MSCRVFTHINLYQMSNFRGHNEQDMLRTMKTMGPNSEGNSGAAVGAKALRLGSR